MNKLVFVRVVDNGGGAESNFMNLSQLIFKEKKVAIEIFTLVDYTKHSKGFINKSISFFKFMLDVRKAAVNSIAILSNVEGYPYILVFISTILLKVNKILWLHSNPFTYLNKISFKQRFLIVFSLIISRKIICASPVSSEFKFIQNKESMFLPNFINNDLVSTNSRNKKLKITRLIFVGSFSEFKRPFLAIDIFILLLSNINYSVEITLEFFGDGLLFDQVKKYAEQKGVLSKLIKFHGYVDVPWEQLQDDSILISTSLTEALPMIFVEAVSRGIPVFCNRYHGSDFFTNHNGLIFACNVIDPKESLDLLKYILNVSEVEFQSRMDKTDIFLNRFFNNSQNFENLLNFCSK